MAAKRIKKSKNKKYNCSIKNSSSQPVTSSPPAKEQHPLPQSKPVPLEKINHTQCSFPFGEKTPYLFCGMIKSNNKNSYCEHHENISRIAGSAYNLPFVSKEID